MAIVCKCAIPSDGLKGSRYILDGAAHTGLAIVNDRTLLGDFIKQLFERFCCTGPFLVEIIIEPTTTLLHAFVSTDTFIIDMGHLHIATAHEPSRL